MEKLTTKRGILLFFILIIVNFIFLVSSGIIFAITKYVFGNDTDLAYLMIISEVVIFILPIIVFLLITKLNPLDILSIRSISLRNVLYVVVLSLIFIPFFSLTSAISSLFSRNISYDVISQLVFNPILAYASIAIAAPLCEELMFRGLLNAHFKQMPLRKMALLNGLLFAIIHLNPHQFLAAFIAGIFFTYLVHYTGSIWASILSHFVINGSQVFLAVTITSMLGQEMIESSAAANKGETFQLLILLSGICLILSPLFVWLFNRFKKNA